VTMSYPRHRYALEIIEIPPLASANIRAAPTNSPEGIAIERSII